MAIRYRKYQNANTCSPTCGKWHGKALVMDDISTKDLAEEIVLDSIPTQKVEEPFILGLTSMQLRTKYGLCSHKIDYDMAGKSKDDYIRELGAL